MRLIFQIGFVLLIGACLLFYLSIYFRHQIPRYMAAVRGDDSDARFKAVRRLIIWGSIYRNVGRVFRLDPDEVEGIAEAVSPLLDDERPMLRAMSAIVIGGFGSSNPGRWLEKLALARAHERSRSADERTRKFVIGDIEEAERQLDIARSIQQFRR